MTSDLPRDDRDVEVWPGESVHLPSADAAETARRFREVLGRFASGVTVVTGCLDGEPHGLTCQAFMSVSLAPPLVAISVADTSLSWPLIRRSGGYCVNLLAGDQVGLAERMAVRGEDKFEGVAWTPSPVTGSPLLAGTLGHVDCELEDVHPAGDHWLAVGRVVDLGDAARSTLPPALTYYRGGYGATR